MRISTQNSQFYFMLPTWFYTPAENIYQILLQKDKVQYESIADYLNSTIQDIDIPGLSFPLHTQDKYNKEVIFTSSKSIYDMNERSSTITFRDVDAKINYFIMRNLVEDYYIKTATNGFDKFGDLSLTTMDQYGDAIFRLKFRNCAITELSDAKFAYNQQSAEEQVFTLGFKYNFLDIEFLLFEDTPDNTYLLQRTLILQDGTAVPNIDKTTEELSPIAALRTHNI